MITGAQVLEQGLFNKLKGSFAHKLDGEGEIANQCTVLQTKGKLMEVQYYDWFIGAESERGWVSQLEFDYWVFYDSEVDWRRRGQESNTRLQEAHTPVKPRKGLGGKLSG